MKILIATHKKVDFPDDEGYVPFQNGRLASEIDLGLLDDSTGINISAKMPYYSELCALFWMALHVDDEIVGLMHYRRYFVPVNKSCIIDGQHIAASSDFYELETNDMVICLEENFSPLTVRQQYEKYHIGSDLDLLRVTVAKLYPGYITVFDEVMLGAAITVYNIFVSHRKIVRQYADWLFPILFHLEESVPYKTYGFYQQRVFAFLSERLFTIWIRANQRDLRVARRAAVYLSY